MENKVVKLLSASLTKGIDKSKRVPVAFGKSDISEALQIKDKKYSFTSTVPTVTSEIKWEKPLLLDDLRFLKKHAKGRTNNRSLLACRPRF